MATAFAFVALLISFSVAYSHWKRNRIEDIAREQAKSSGDEKAIEERVYKRLTLDVRRDLNETIDLRLNDLVELEMKRQRAIVVESLATDCLFVEDVERMVRSRYVGYLAVVKDTIMVNDGSDMETIRLFIRQNATWASPRARNETLKILTDFALKGNSSLQGKEQVEKVLAGLEKEKKRIQEDLSAMSKNGVQKHVQ